MKSSFGRHLFFDLVAEGLLIGFGTSSPKLITIDTDVTRVPASDIDALARAICDHTAPGRGITELTLSQLPGPLASERSYVIDGQSSALGEVAKVIGQRSETGGSVVIYNFADDGTDFPALKYEPSTSSDVLYPAIQELFDQCDKRPDGLALLRFQLRGFDMFDEEYELFERPPIPTWADPTTSERFCARLASIWRFSDAPVSAMHILEWLKQFDDAGFGQEARALLVYLHRYGYVTEQKITARMTDAYRDLTADLGSPPVAVAFQEPGKSESKLAYKLRPNMSFVTPEIAIELANGAGPSNFTNFVCFDDCIGSGETVEKYLFRSEYNAQVGAFRDIYANGRARLHIVVYHSDLRGVQRIEQHPAACGAVRVKTLSPLDTTHRVFSHDSRIILDQARRIAFKQFCEAIGGQLFPGGPLGWGDCQWCVAYDYSIPDTSLPVLFATASPPLRWMPLFPRQR